MKKKVRKTVKRQTGKKQQRHKLFFVLLGMAAVLAGAAVLFFAFKFFAPPCANSESCVRNLSGNYEPTNKAVFMGKNITVPSYLAEEKIVGRKEVLGETSNPNKHIYVDLSSQQLYAREGNNLIFSFPISSGKWYPTPTGDFRIWVKLRYTRMSGGNPAIGTYYNLPNVPFTMFYYNDQVGKSRGFSLHGAYWHNNFGHPMSHGCINISIPDAERLYNWADPPTAGNATYTSAANPGTLVTVYGTTPAQ